MPQHSPQMFFSVMERVGEKRERETEKDCSLFIFKYKLLSLNVCFPTETDIRGPYVPIFHVSHYHYHQIKTFAIVLTENQAMF